MKVDDSNKRSEYLRISRKIKATLESRSKRSIDDLKLTPAAVLVLLYPKDGIYHVLLHKRTKMVAHHKMEIAFPGGVQDGYDVDYEATALRETYEEMGILPDDVTVLGALDDVLTRTGFGIKVIIGTMPELCHLSPNRHEVAQILQVPIPHLMDTNNQREELGVSGDNTRTQRCYTYCSHRIVGVTARIITQLLDLVSSLDISRKEYST